MRPQIRVSKTQPEVSLFVLPSAEALIQDSNYSTTVFWTVYALKGLFSMQTVVLRLWRKETRKFGRS